MPKKFNHYVPQFYLKNFSNDKNIKETSKKRHVGMYNINAQEKVEKASIKKNAGLDYLYGHMEKIENKLEKYETKWAPIISKIIKNEAILLNKNEDNLMLEFFWLSESRTLYLNNYIEKHIQTLDKLLSEDCKLKRKSNQNDDNDEIIIFEEYLKDSKAIAKVMKDLKLILIQNNSNIEFFTSDCPSVKYNQLFMDKKYIINYNYAQKGFQGFLPISPKFCLCFFDKDVYDFILDDNNKLILESYEEIKKLNKLFIYNSDNFIFFQNAHKKDIKKYLSLKHNEYKKDITEPFEKDNRIYLPFHTPGIYKNLNFKFFTTKDEFKDLKFEYTDDGPLRDSENERRKN